MNKITLFSASALMCVVCTTCSTPSDSLIQEAQAFADMNKSNSSGIKCISNSSNITQGAAVDSTNAKAYSGIICTEN